MQIEGELLLDTKPFPNNDGTTLAALFGTAILKAEELCGPRLINHSFLGFSFNDAGPQTCQLNYQHDLRMLLIQLHPSATTDVGRAIFQVGQETIHCLAPSIPLMNTNLETGLATFFGLEFAKQYNWTFPAPGNDRSNYKRAYNAVRRLLSYDRTIIKRIREKLIANGQPAFFSSISENDLKQECSGAERLIQLLLQPFPLM